MYNTFMQSDEKKLAILAGNGELPVLLAKSAKEKGYITYGIAVTEQAKYTLKGICDNYATFPLGQIAKIINYVKEQKLTNVAFSGKFKKMEFFKNIHTLDWQAIKYISRMINFSDDTIHAILDELAKDHNIEILPQTKFLEHLYQEKEILTEGEPTIEERIDIEYAMRVAKELATLDVAQTVVVKNKMVIAIEGIDGTDETIKRGCKLAKGRVVVAKAARKNQDERFDIPAIGERTVEALGKNGSGILAFESGQVFLANKEETLQAAKKYNVSLIAV